MGLVRTQPAPAAPGLAPAPSSRRDAAGRAGPRASAAGAAALAPLSFAAIYDRWFDDVSRWVRLLGGPHADHEDLAQEVFLVVRRRLGDFDGRNLAGWLFKIASRQVGNYRRRVWFRQVFSLRRPVALDDLPHDGATPAAALERKERQALVERLLGRMSEKRRTTFVLFEIEGYSGEEIAAIQRIPIKTVWTRLHHARKEFLKLVARHRAAERAGEPWND
jgi:RNA polymerase sigma-70 factor, ECF subfamily